MPDSSHDEEWKTLLINAAGALQAGDLQIARQLYDGYIVRDPARAEAFYKRAGALNALGLLELSLADYDHAIALNPRYGHAFCNRGWVLERMGRKEDAVRSYDAALSIDPGDSLALYNRGTVLRQLGSAREALASFDEAILVKPDYAEAYVNRGNILQEMWRHEDAVISFNKAIELKPIFAEAFQGRGTSLQQLKQLQPAIDSFSQALALNPHQKFVAGMRRYLQMHICDWNNLDADLEQLTLDTRRGISVCPPFAMLSLFDSPSLQRIAAEVWIRSECSATKALGAFAGRSRGRKMRVGYFSPDFRDHPVAQLIAELFEQHDRTRFELTAFSLGPSAHDDMHARLQRSFDRFIDVQDKSDVEVASLARQLEIDVAVDLCGLTEHSRTNIFALRAAPIQINYLGYPGTMGAGFIDYLIADRIVVPESQLPHFAEKVIFLPNFYLPSDSIRPPKVNPFSRRELGLPDRGFVFCCFNHVGKLMPSTFDSWMRILKQVDGSMLWLANTNSVAADQLRHEASQRGIQAGRLVFASRIDSLAEHRARLGHADLFLDTSPYNAHVTALDALWAGLPLLTLIGEAFAGRVAASLLTVIGLPELIATSRRQYEEIAVYFGNNADRMAEIRAKLLRSRANTQAFDIPRFAAYLEAAYSNVFDRYSKGLPPDHIHMEA
jgi:predicted O-linked N-acetylglucosamine transferase (SPINDLY family)